MSRDGSQGPRKLNVILSGAHRTVVSIQIVKRGVEGPVHFVEKWYYVYIMDKQVQDALIGITSKLHLRIFQHKTGAFKGFTSNYNRLVYWEQFKNVNRAIAREKQLKGWRRIKKIQLIVSMNPTWNDLASEWYPAKYIGPSTRP